MTILIHLDRSEAVAASHGGEAGRTTIEFDDTEGPWVQLTYGSVRTQDGDLLIEQDDGGCWLYGDGAFSDVVIEFVDQKEAERTVTPIIEVTDGTAEVTEGHAVVIDWNAIGNGMAAAESTLADLGSNDSDRARAARELIYEIWPDLLASDDEDEDEDDGDG